MELKHYIGSKIKEFRKSAKLTQTDLAEKLGTTKQTVSRYEKGDRRADQDVLFQLVDIFGVSIDDFFPSNESNSYTPTPAVVNLDKHLNTENKDSWINHGEQLLSSQQAKEQAQPVRLADYASHTENTLRGSAMAPESNIDEKVANFDDYRKRVTATVDFAASAGTGAWQEENLGIEVSFYEDDMAEDYDSIGIVVGNSMEPVLKNGDYLFVKVTTDIPNGALSIWQVNGENFVKKFRNNGSPYLESLNPDYDDIDLTPDDDIRPLAVVVDVYREG